MDFIQLFQLVSFGCALATITPQALESGTKSLIRESGVNRTAGSKGSQNAARWIKSQITAIKGWEYSEQKFDPDLAGARSWWIEKFNQNTEGFVPKDSTQYKNAAQTRDGALELLATQRGKKGTNLILRKTGLNPSRAKELLVIGAHYDTIVFNREKRRYDPEASAPGANDNGAAVIGLIELARELAALKSDFSIELVFFDFSEPLPPMGAKAYVENLNKNGLQATFLDLEMIGHDKAAKNHVKLYTRTAGHPFGDAEVQFAEKFSVFLRAEGLKPEISRGNFDWSDHLAFWNGLQKAVVVSHDWQRTFGRFLYHDPSDKPEFVNWDFAARITKATAKFCSSFVAHKVQKQR